MRTFIQGVRCVIVTTLVDTTKGATTFIAVHIVIRLSQKTSTRTSYMPSGTSYIRHSRPAKTLLWVIKSNKLM